MDYFLTTYAKDYKWPVISRKKVDDTAGIVEATSLAKKKYVDMIENVSKAQEAEVVPAQVGASPQGSVSKFDQPSTYLRKLYTKYPYLYEIMKITPPAELAKKVYMEKYKTTYQEDYGLQGFMDLPQTIQTLSEGIEKEKVPGVCGEKLKKIQQKDKKECACDHDAGHQPCTCAEDAHPIRKIAWKAAPISKMVRVPRDPETKKIESEKKDKEKALPRYKAYRSEYKDSISKIGAIIIKKKLLYCEEDESSKVISE